MGFGLSDVLGVFSGGKVGSKFLPSNDILTDYGITDGGNLFRVKMSAFKNTQITLKTQGGKISIESDPPADSIAEFEVLHNAETLILNHNHNWGKSTGIIGKVDEMFNKGFMGLKGGQILNLLKGASDLKNRDQTQLLSEFNTWGGLDVAEVYQGNSRPEFTVRFALVASQDPLLEVVLPALLFTYLSYPTLSKEKDMKKFFEGLDGESKNIGGVISSAAGNIVSNQNQVGAQAEETQNQASSVLKESFDAIKNATTGKWRYRVGDAPPFWVVSSSNGIIHLPNAHISNITVNYFGPWVEKPPKASFAEAIQTLGNSSGMGLDPTTVFPDSSLIGNLGQGALDIISNFIDSSSNLGGYPTYATVDITFRHAFEKIFGEEWLLSMTGATSHFGSTSSITR